ncbi:CHAD domain-containing protein [Auraticoccus sp. F435]|uniref:CHAD domain-containing protein n=1 Tax=Auraticoccus cholistanensis TaxID=2656650 RepID=A0A6A9USY8_9ACTN|nr:CYTH and CHAD domain-containing protein [Auraticoccus cholistanensis]MVA74845.1 CHAD domain-containing protein [Auraticoccus cholistanensis]
MVDQVLEREDKFDVPESFRLPDLQELAPAGVRWETEELHLQNTYHDTPSGHLAGFGVTLRHREGGTDAGWHLKVPEEDGRVEVRDGSAGDELPATLADVVVGLRSGEELSPVARVTVTRTVHRLLTGDGTLLLELADDRVSGVAMGEEARISSWRELEVELGPGGDEELQRRVGQQLLAAGATPSATASKLQRTLGSPAGGTTDAGDGTVAALVRSYLAAQCRQIVRGDVQTRLGEPPVHKFRVAIRRLRSTLRVFGPLFDPDAAQQLETELVWLAGLLGQVRDRDVLSQRLAGQLAELPAEVVLGPVAAHVETTLSLERAEHLSRLTEAMAGERYAALMGLVRRWLTDPPLTAEADRPAKDARRHLRRAGKKLDRRLQAAGGDVEALHRARKAAKRYRYAAELLAQAGGKKAARIAESTSELQTLLGEHQDSVVSAAFLRRLGAAAGAGGGQNGFTYGYLVAREEHRAEQIRAELARRWGDQQS